MNRSIKALAAVVVLGTASAFPLQPYHFAALAQPAKGAAAAFERVREVVTNRFKDMKLVGDPDKDFATLLVAHHEDLIFLAKTQLEFGGDRQLRQLAEKILDEQQKQIDEVKQWQVRMRQPDYQAQPNQSPPGSGPLDQKSAQGAPVQSAQAQPAPAPAPAPGTPASSTAAAPAANLPTVSGTVEKVDTAAGKITIEHGPIPNLNMDGMTMVFRANDPAILKTVKAGDKVQFQADRVTGQLSVIKIQKGR